MTEVCGIASYTTGDLFVARPESCGPLVPTLEGKIVNEAGESLPVGERGELCVKGAPVIKGYLNRPEATAETIVDGWLHTGDIGYFDDEGFLYIHDRVKDMIVSGGENIYPAEVENALLSHPQIADAAVIGIPDDKWGEATKAFIVQADGEPLDEAEVISYVRTQIAGYKCPKTVEHINELPRNPSGKILRKDLRAPYWEGKERNVS